MWDMSHMNESRHLQAHGNSDMLCLDVVDATLRCARVSVRVCVCVCACVCVCTCVRVYVYLCVFQ